jgi:glycosyltransferase involved in cell wall biosynthesis
MIKVLHLIKSLGRGGAEMLLVESLALHNSEMFELHYLYFLPWKNQVVQQLTEAGGKVNCLEATNSFNIFLRASDVIKYIKKHNIDLLPCHMPVTGLLGRYVHSKINIPILYTEHNLQERYHIITRFFNKITFNYQTETIAVSGDVKNSIDKNIKPRINVSVVENGINADTFVRNKEDGMRIRSKYNIPQNAVVVGNIAVFRSQKRLKEWVEVFASSSKSNANLFGLLVGQGPFMEQVKATIDTLGLQNKIILAGLQSDVKSFYSAIDIFMMTSLYEGLPIALLEAMSMECAVVSTNAGGIKSVIRNGEDGFLVDVSDWKDLSILLDKLYLNPNLIEQYGAKARIRVMESHDLNKTVLALEKMYLRTVTSIDINK